MLQGPDDETAQLQHLYRNPVVVGVPCLQLLDTQCLLQQINESLDNPPILADQHLDLILLIGLEQHLVYHIVVDDYLILDGDTGVLHHRHELQEDVLLDGHLILVVEVVFEEAPEEVHVHCAPDLEQLGKLE